MLILGDKRKKLIVELCSTNFADFLFGKNQNYKKFIPVKYLLIGERDISKEDKLDDHTLLTNIEFLPLWWEELSLYGYDNEKGIYCAYHLEEDSIEYFGSSEKSLILFKTFELWDAFIYSDEELISLGVNVGVDSKKIMEIINSTKDYDKKTKAVSEYLKTM